MVQQQSLAWQNHGVQQAHQLIMAESGQHCIDTAVMLPGRSMAVANQTHQWKAGACWVAASGQGLHLEPAAAALAPAAPTADRCCCLAQRQPPSGRCHRSQVLQWRQAPSAYWS